MQTDRRGLLKGLSSLPVLGTAIAIPATAKAMTVKEKMNYHFDQFWRAAQEIDPRITSWRQPEICPDSDSRTIHTTASRVLYSYEGEGWYLTRYNDDERSASIKYVNYAPKYGTGLTPSERFYKFEAEDYIYGRYFITEDDLELHLVRKLPLSETAHLKRPPL